ncbi:hypothetical protein PMIT1303_00208 [Prochlorococcus sp. MIT 1303]|nr:hypothetical protein PMIT1303_00208 [Prochlorococcus sp. MIT 1303]
MDVCGKPRFFCHGALRLETLQEEATLPHRLALRLSKFEMLGEVAVVNLRLRFQHANLRGARGTPMNGITA